MRPALSHTPRGRSFGQGEAAAVRRRRVLFIPGYDPEGETRYRMLFVREMIRHAKRFGLSRRDISKARPIADLPGQSWDVEVATERWATHTTYEVLRWDDMVRRDFRRPLPIVIGLLFTGLVHSLVTGTMSKFWRLHWKFGCVILYPSVVVLLVLAIGLGLGFGVEAVAGLAFPAPGWGRWALRLGVMGLVFSAFYPLGARWFVWHLANDWVFNWQYGMGWRPDYEARAERFARHLLAAADEGGVDELLVVGHSSGATLAVDVVGRALAAEPGLAERVPLSLLTIGSCIPLVALNHNAHAYHAHLGRIMTCRNLFWAEYQAPQDWINFIGFEPLRDVKLELDEADCANPVVRSPLFKETIAEKTYREIVYRPFRMHFQFLIANDHPGAYDYLMIATGPLSLVERVRLGEEAIEKVLGARGRLRPATEAELAAAEKDRLASEAV